MTIKKSLDPKLLRIAVKASDLNFKTTQSLKSLNEFVGQKRAIKSLLFGVGIKSHGFNLYAMGPNGIGKRSLVNSILQEHAKSLPAPPDWCYIHNFTEPDQPIALTLPSGIGLKLQKDMELFVAELESATLTVLESDKYREKLVRINEYFESLRLRKIKSTKRNKVDITPSLYKAQHAKEVLLQASSISAILKPYMRKLKHKYRQHQAVVQYLNMVLQDAIDHASDYVYEDPKTHLYTYLPDHPGLINYRVNLLVNHTRQKGTPIVFEEMPSYSNLIARIEHIARDGILVTNFTLIKAGSLLLANGGYLIIEARKLKHNMDAWEALKSSLYSNQIKIKIIDSNEMKPVSLQPMPIPLDIKIILIGDRNTYYNLCVKDPDFSKLFKVPVDFDEQIDRNKKNIHLYARLIATIIKSKKLLPFSVSAVAAIITQCSRMAEDVEKLTTYFSSIEDLVIESHYWANSSKKKLVREEDVQCALDAKRSRLDRSQLLYYEDIERQFIIIKTTGATIGQVNCLSVRRVGNFAYGHPTRVTARVRWGRGHLIDIQREIKLAGPMHSKAGLIISNFLASRFNHNQPFSLHASLAFEQLYCWTDGDSASVGELCALLSAIADVPILQSLAVTGSIDQNGVVQAIGGVNEKIEGFYNVCKEHGLTGHQGVIIPAVNMKNLMLDEVVQQAAEKGKFHIYTINTIDEAVTLLMGVEAGVRGKDGKFASGTVYDKIEKKLKKLSSIRKPPSLV